MSSNLTQKGVLLPFSDPQIFLRQSHGDRSVLGAPHDAPVVGESKRVPMVKPPQQFLPDVPWRVYSPRETSILTGNSERTLQRLRVKGGGPEFVKLTGKKIGYTGEALRRWIESRSVRSTSDASVRLAGGAA